MDFKKYLLDELGISMTIEQEKLFSVFYDELIEYNRHTNLTRITDIQEVYYKHFYDSLTLVKTIDLLNCETLCDMGAGAGFPSIPLKIIFPHLKVTIVDSLNKRIKFVEKLCKNLDIKFVEAIHDRIEIYALKNTQKFDLVTARALGNLSLILEMGVPMVKTNGHFIAYKSRMFKEELDKSQNAIKVLNLTLNNVVEFKLPQEMGDRILLDFIKIKHINGYPRNYSIMEKRPL